MRMADKKSGDVQDPADRTATARIGVLLVDDHVVVRRGLASLIGEEPDMEVSGEADGVDAALDAIRRHRPRLAVIDISLKDGDGLELVRQITEQYPDVLPLVLSMYDEAVYAE